MNMDMIGRKVVKIMKKIMMLILIIVAHISVGYAQEQRLVIQDIVMRYDGAQEFGTLAIFVCNISTRPTRIPDMTLRANGVEITISGGEFLSRRQCDYYFNPETTFQTFGITEAQEVTVTARLNEQQVDSDVTIGSLGTVGTRTSLVEYEQCRQQYDLRYCVLHAIDTPLSDPQEVKVGTEDYFIIAPRMFEDLIPFYMVDLQNCASNISTYLGVDIPNSISRRIIINDEWSGSEAWNQGFILTHLPNETIRTFVTELDDWWSRISDNHCADPHEMTHIFVNNSVIPHWLNEGLATYMEDVSRTRYWYLLPMPVECVGDGFVSYYTGQRTQERLLNLRGDKFDPNILDVKYYYSGACFWDYIRQNHGDEAVQHIVQRLLTVGAIPNRLGQCISNQTVYFMRDIVIPVIGRDILSWSENALGVGELYTGCES